MLALVFGVGCIAGVLNVMAGGGSLLTLPVLLFLGLPASLANGTNRVAILTQNIVAVAAFRRHGVSDFRTGFRLALFTLPGAVLGAYLATGVSDVWFRRILAGVILFGIWTMFVRPPAVLADRNVMPRVTGAAALSMIGIGFYGGFIQAGVGMLFLLVLYNVLRLDLVRTNAFKVFIVLVYTLPSLGVFVATGNVDWGLGLVLAAGNALGGWVATHWSVRGGDRPIRVVVAAALLLMALRLVVAG